MRNVTDDLSDRTVPESHLDETPNIEAAAKTRVVWLKNISARVDRMKVPQGAETRTTIDAPSEYEAIQRAVGRLFDRCRFWSEGKYGTDGTLIGTIHYGKAHYGRILVHVS